MPKEEIHLLDDFAAELLEKSLRIKRFRVSMIGGIMQIGLAIYIITTHHYTVHGFNIGLLPLPIGVVTLYFQWKYRTPKRVQASA